MWWGIFKPKDMSQMLERASSTRLISLSSDEVSVERGWFVRIRRRRRNCKKRKQGRNLFHSRSVVVCVPPTLLWSPCLQECLGCNKAYLFLVIFCPLTIILYGCLAQDSGGVGYIYLKVLLLGPILRIRGLSWNAHGQGSVELVESCNGLHCKHW